MNLAVSAAKILIDDGDDDDGDDDDDAFDDDWSYKLMMIWLMLIEPDGKNDQGLSNRLQGGRACGKQNSFLVDKDIGKKIWKR